MVYTIGIDLGGTRIKGVVLDDKQNVVEQLYMATNDGEEAVWKKAILDTVRQLSQTVKATNVVVGISAPGICNETNTAVSCMPGRLQGLEHFNWTDYLQQPSFVLNDAVAALMAEARLGAAAGKQHVALLTLGTGVGGALLINGKPYVGAFHKAGHLGHMVIDSAGDADVTGMPGSLEDVIGNCTIKERSQGKFNDTHELLQAYRGGDDFAKIVWLTSVRKLAVGIASISNILSPEVVILGGGITEAGDALFEPLKEYFDLYEWRPLGNKTPIIKAAFGDMAGAIGAACFAAEMHLENGTH
jgi:glucokinase